MQTSVDFVAGFVGGWIMADELHITVPSAAYRGQGIGHELPLCFHN